MWRKNRVPVSSLCRGVDGNRNFGYNWLVPDENGNAGASTSPCSGSFGMKMKFANKMILFTAVSVQLAHLQ